MGDTTTAAVDVRGLQKSYGDVVALDGLDLRVEAGTVFGLLGPNGAGKTTLVRILATLLAPTAGRARCSATTSSPSRWRSAGGSGWPASSRRSTSELTGRENLEMIGAPVPAPAGRGRAGAPTSCSSASGWSTPPTGASSTYSGGMRRRLDLAAGLIGRPPVVLLDEPTTGLDPRSRQELWRIVDELRREGTTVLLTTQYLDEADRLAQRIAVVDRGRIVAAGHGRAS